MENINELVKYDITDAVIAKYREDCMHLTINGIDDKQGYQEVNDARLFIKAERVSVEKTRKELKEESLKFGRAVDAEAKRITAGLSEIEEHLEAEKKKVDDEVARRKFEAEQREKLPERIKKLAAIGEIPSEEEYGRYETELLKLDDNAFTELLNRLTAEKLERQRIEQDAKEAELKAAKDKVEAEQRAIDAQKLEAEREARYKEEIERAKQAAAEDARLLASIEAKRVEDDRIKVERQADLEAQRIEAERPDNDKLGLLVWFFKEEIPYPKVSTKRAKAKLVKVHTLVHEIIDELKAA